MGATILSLFLSYLFKQVEPHIMIQTAPSWYMQEIDKEKLTKSTYYDGDLDAISKAKKRVIYKFKKSIELTTNIAVERYLANIKKTQNILIAKKFRTDKNISNFVYANIHYENITYLENKKRAFVRAYIPIKNIKIYEEKRLLKIQDGITESLIGEVKKDFM